MTALILLLLVFPVIGIACVVIDACESHSDAEKKAALEGKFSYFCYLNGVGWDDFHSRSTDSVKLGKLEQRYNAIRERVQP